MEIKTIDKAFYEALGKELNSKRRAKDISFRRMAKRTGRTFQMLDNYFLGKAKMKPETFYDICRVLDLDAKIKITVSIE